MKHGICHDFWNSADVRELFDASCDCKIVLRHLLSNRLWQLCPLKTFLAFYNVVAARSRCVKLFSIEEIIEFQKSSFWDTPVQRFYRKSNSKFQWDLTILKQFHVFRSKIVWKWYLWALYPSQTPRKWCQTPYRVTGTIEDPTGLEKVAKFMQKSPKSAPIASKSPISMISGGRDTTPAVNYCRI